MRQQPDIFSDPHAGTPVRGVQPAEDDPRLSDPHAGEPLRMARRSWLDRTTGPEDFPVYNLAKGAVNVVREIPAGVKQLVTDPIGSVRLMGEAQGRLGVEAKEAFDQGEYMRAARKGLHYLLPLIGPMIDPSADKMLEGKYAEGAGEVATNAVLTFAGGRPMTPAARSSRTAARLTPQEAAAIEFARQEGIPLDAGTATGSQFVKNLQKKAASSWGGANTAERAQAAQGDALAATAERLAARANNGGPAVGAVEAGEGVRAALEGRVKDFHGQANRAYTQFRNAEAAAPEEFIEARPITPVASHVTPEQAFPLRWLAKDLEDFQFQQGGTSLGTRRRAYESFDPVEAAALQHNPRVAGTPVQSMFHAMGIKGSRAEIATKIERFLSGQSKDHRFARLSDALNEAWDGQRFDFDLVADDTLTALGIRRRDLKSPIGLPDFAEPGAAAFFPDEAIPAAPRGAGAPGAGAEAMRLAIDLKPHKEALRPLYEKLQTEREITGALMGDKGRAAVALEGLLNGPDFAPMSAVEAALGPIKKLARVDDIRELRTPGQGVAARVAGELDTAVRTRAQAAGPNVAQALSEGRTATRMKHMSADVMRWLAPAGGEPVSVFRRLTANKDAGIAKLRELQKHAPDQVPQIARALLEDIFDKPTAEGGFKFADGAAARWGKLGPETKRMLFTEPGHVKALDNFFLLAKRITQNPNPSGTAQVMNATNLIAGIPMYGLAKLLYTPTGARALTGAMDVSVRPGSPARAAALAQLARVARDEGVILEFPKVAEGTRDQQ